MYVLFWLMLILDFISPIVAFLWVNWRTKSLWSAIRASFLTATVGAFVVSGIVGCLLFVPNRLSGDDSPSWAIFVDAGIFGLASAGMGLFCLLPCAAAWAICRSEVTSDLPSGATSERESIWKP